jgi:hypothetical protein
MMRLIVSRSTRKTDVPQSSSDPAGADAARWDRLTGRRGASAPRTSTIISNRPGVLVLSTLVVVALSSSLLLSNADVSRRSGELSLREGRADSTFKEGGGSGIGAEIRNIVRESEKDIAAAAHKIMHPTMPTHEEVEKYRGSRRREFDPYVQQVGYQFPALRRVDPDDPFEDLSIPRDEHLGVGPMIRNWMSVSAHALLAGAMIHGSAAAAIDTPPDDSSKFEQIQKQLKDINSSVERFATSTSTALGEFKREMNKDLKSGLDQMETKITNIGLNQNATQLSLDGLRDEVGKLRGDVETLRARMQTQINANRSSLYNPNDASTTDSSTARVEMINTYATEVAFLINRRTYYVAPGETRTSDAIPAGTFTYEVVGIQPPTTRTVGPNKIFTVRVYTR